MTWKTCLLLLCYMYTKLIGKRDFIYVVGKLSGVVVDTACNHDDILPVCPQVVEVCQVQHFCILSLSHFETQHQ